MEMKHFCHDHSLVLNDRYIARQGDVCFCCRDEIVSCKSYIYSCSTLRSTTRTSSGLEYDKCARFLLHKTCAHLPDSIENPTNHKEFLVLRSHPRKKPTLFQLEFDKEGDICHCNICDMELLYGYCNSDYKFCLCLKCALFRAKELTITHVAHPQHSLALIHRPSSFKCDACGLEEKDMSYKCQTCPFWIHKSCGDAPNLLSLFPQSLHDHPLILFYGRPQRYHTYNQWCRLCTENIGPLEWFYKCRDQCTYFTHFRCARSRCNENETYDSNLCHLPAADESSLNLLVERFLKLMQVNNNFSTAEDGPNIEHWSHREHPLQLITHNNELNNQNEDDRTVVLLCDGCVKPIPTDGDLFYGCVLCKYFLHKVCAQIPQSIEMDLTTRRTCELYKFKRPYAIPCCGWCGVYSNGFFIDLPLHWIHIGCGNLPKTIKHEAHRHQLHQVYLRNGHGCNACGRYFKDDVRMHRCEQCEFYLCQGCSMKARTVTHPWDPHPLHLRYDAGMVEEHDYEFNCEFCSEEINTNFWFYHCSDCGLSFHLGYCFEMSCFRYYSNVKFGHTDISIPRLHDHSLKFVLNKKVRCCQRCHKKQLGKPVLECTPCKAIFCADCSLASWRYG